MNKAISLLALIKSLSKAEKRYLKLYSNLQNGEKGYLILFELLENNTSIDDIYKQFCIKQKGKRKGRLCDLLCWLPIMYDIV